MPPPKSSTTESLFSEERRIRIVDYIHQHTKATVAVLAREFKVSAATIRTDLHALQRAGLLIRTHGGAIEKTKTGFELDARHREVQHLPEKQRIARGALSLIEDGDTIILDTGTTTLELAKLLHQKKNLTVVTNDIVIVRTLEEFESVTVAVLGGILRKGFHCLIGLQDWGSTARLAVDKAFMGANSFSLNRGAMTPDLHQAEAKRQLMAIASKVILLCDNSKIGKVSFAQFARLDQLNALVIDAIGKSEKHRLEKLGVEVVSV